MLYEQREEWHERCQDALQARERPPLLREKRVYDWSGRGGTAVWRVKRKVSLQDFEDWLVTREPGAAGEYVMELPGWVLHVPPDWHAHAPALTAAGQLPSPFAEWAAGGRALVFPYRNRQAL
ncbi:hypothetical protein AB0M29_43350 [Streptomyces sp. NPDC051976]|uniref:hypothetical protein n=1 Tax=Streptomyces sp. NPDC051976 TaxID=3154947 RepID=UPI00343D9CFF